MKEATVAIERAAMHKKLPPGVFVGFLALSSDAVIATDDHQRIVFFNAGAERIFGWRADEVDGQSLDYRHGPVRSMPAHWPGPAPGAASIMFEDSSGAHPYQTFQGPWAWFRLLDAASMRVDSDVRFTASFQAGGHQGAVIIEPTSIRNPYQVSVVRHFRCGS